MILPYHIPSYLQDVISITTKGIADSEVSIAVHKLFSAINDQALKLLESTQECDLNKSKTLLESLVILQPENANVHYNLACADSLLKNVESSIDHLKTAFKFGYSNLQHLLSDPDLAYLRVTKEFKEFIQGVKAESPIEETKPIELTHTQPAEPVVEKKEEKIEIIEKKVEEKVEEKIEEKVEEKVGPKPERWEKEVDSLKSMGFQLDSSVMVAILDHHGGKIENALQDLM